MTAKKSKNHFYGKPTFDLCRQACLAHLNQPSGTSNQKLAYLLKGGNPELFENRRYRSGNKCRRIIQRSGALILNSQVRRDKCNPAGDFYKSTEWRQVRYLALKNAEGRCECCGGRSKDGVTLHVDHIRPRTHYPELALSLDNLQIMCDDCNIGKGVWDCTSWK